mmetsp:Transcript_20042/g.34302  ORF Transcript_20042/g.34302 Transcript_20042/m.34302 type:complete len:200 (+) Transcript_20042:106-705(+)
MKVFGIYIFNCNDPSKPIVLSKVLDLTSFGFFQRGSAEEVMNFVAREVTKKTTDKQSVLHLDYVAFAKIDGKSLGALVLTDKEYPSRVGHRVTDLALKKFHELYKKEAAWSEITEDTLMFTSEFEALLKQSQEPEQVDDVEKIRKDLDDTHDTLHKTISDLMVRGEKLEDLAKDSEDLGMFSKQYMNKAEDLNSCCLLL